MERPISSTVQKRVSNQNTKISEPTTQETSEIMNQEKESNLLTHVESDQNATVDTVRASSFTATASEDATMHELAHLMQRPTLISNGTINSDNSVVPFSYGQVQYQNMVSNFTNTLGFVTLLGFPSSIVQKNPVVSAKIKQFSYFKGDMKLEIKVNKAPQVSGCLMAVYLPRGGMEIDKTNFTLQGLTSLPYKILDYSTDTSLTMTVPYIDEVDYFNFQQGTTTGENVPDDYGYIGIFNLVAPTSGVSNSSISYSLFGSFENIELRLPTADTVVTPPFVAQSGRIQRIPADDIMSGVNESTKVSLNYSSQEIDNSKVKYDSKETSLQYVLGRENIIGTLNYKATDGPNHYMGKIRCFPKRPVCVYKAKDQGFKPFYYPIAMQYGTFDYVCNLFQRWTGTIEVGIRMIKTKFHYGRIAVVFDPFNRINDADTNGLGSLLSTNYSAIIDLNAEDGEEGSSNYYRFPVPYMNNVGYTSIGRDYKAEGSSKFCLPQDTILDVPAEPVVTVGDEREVYNPYLRFYALTELGYLDAASNQVPILVSIKAGKDFELSVPTVNVTKAKPALNPEASEFYCQSGAIRLVPNEISTARMNEVTCSGEKIDDLMTLTKRFTSPTVRVTRIEPNVMLSSNAIESVAPIGTPLIEYRSKEFTGVVLGLTGNTIEGYKMSNVEAVQLLYKFTYGGRRYKCTSTESGSTIMARLIHMGRQSNSFKNMSPCIGVSYPISGSMIVNTTVNNFIEVDRNFYSNRKLVSKLSDDVITQFISFSPTKSHDLEFKSLNHMVKLGPFMTAYGNNTDRKIRKYPHIDFTDYQALEKDIASPSVRGLSEFDGLNTEEGTFFLEGPVKVADVNIATVLEAMPEHAGFTFLMNPPCVAFL